MFINEKGSIDIASIEKNLPNVDLPTDEEIENMLAENYRDAHAGEAMELGFTTVPASTMLFKSSGILPDIGKKLWKKLKKLICAVLDDSSTMSEIIKAVVDALKEILPGGKIVAWLIEKIVKYILGSGGIGKFCAV